MEDNKKKKRLVFLILLIIVITGIGVTFGYFIWNSTTNTDVSLSVKGAIVELNDGTDIKGANLIPVDSYTNEGGNVVKKDFNVKLKKATEGDVTVDFKLRINSIDSGLNHSSFKYNLVNASGTSVKSGDFATSKAGDSIDLLTLSSTNGTLSTALSSYTLYVYIDGTMGDNPSSMMNQSFDFSLDVTGTNSSLERETSANTAVTKIEALDDGTAGNSGSGVYKVTHSVIAKNSSATESEIPAVTDCRYYGPSPNNYICLDMEGQSTCPDKHLYRIIGSIYEEKENTNRLKVIKATSLTDGTTSAFSWGYKVNNGRGSSDNIWATITSGNYSNSLTSGSQLMKLLNSGAWWNGTSGSYYNGSATATTFNFTNYKLSDKAKSYINTSRYYLGGYNNATLLTNEMYGYERGTLRYNTDRPLYWEGMVGLMYPSDYGYTAGNTCVTGTRLYDYLGECSDKDWLFYYSNTYQWLMSPNSGDSSYVFHVGYDGEVYYNFDIIGNGDEVPLAVRPAFYLTSSTLITSGDGSIDNPYLIGL